MKIILATILLAHILILSKINFFPYPELFVYPYLTNHGLKPYSQILDQHFPGLMFFPINLDNLGMNSPDIAKIWLMITVILTHLLLFLVSRDLFKVEKKAILVNLFFLMWQPFFEGGVLWIDSFLAPILLGAFYFLLKFKNKKKFMSIFLTGLILGVGIVFKQVVIPLSGLVLLYLFWQGKNFKAARYYLLGLSIPVGLMLVYLSSIGVLNDFFYWTIVFNLTVFAQYGRKLPELTSLARVGFVLAASAGAFFGKERQIVWLLLIFIVGSLATIYARFDFVHFQVALPFVLIATAFGFTEIWHRREGKLAVLGYLVITVWWLTTFYRGSLKGDILFFDTQVKEIAPKIEEQTQPGEKIFIFGAPPHLYQMTQTLPAGDLFVFQFPWFMMVAEDRVLEGIKKDQPDLVVSDRSVKIGKAKITDYASKLDNYIQENYQIVDQVEETLIMRKKIQ